MNVLVVDDEPAARHKLRRLLAAHPDVQQVHEAGDAPAALALLPQIGSVALAILDIEMPGGSGLQLAREIGVASAGRTLCVFSTAYGQHALQAFELGAVDYLLKPYTAGRLAGTLARVRALLGQATPAPALRAPAGQWWVQTHDGHKRIALADVQWVAAADNYVALHLPPACHLQRGTLNEWLQQPEVVGLFLRVHRSHAVNPAHVLQVQPQGSGEAVLTLRCGQQLRVARRHRALLQTLRP